ncbi:MAG TPA: chromate transporter [Bryobacteraceae bacterium]|nr:chromate transporter [Bryobacteraceae bacterium]
MSVWLLYFFLLKSTLTSFSGLSSLPILHADLVVRRHVLTERQLNTAVAAGRTGPGPNGLYVVSIGFLVAGIPGAVAGYAAMVTPAFLILPILRFFSRRAAHPAVRGAIRALLLSAAGLLISSALPIGRATITDAVTAVVAVASFAVLAFTRVDTLIVVAASAAIGWMGAVLRGL